ncbi:MAG: YebC/PmpR family DNA-binding transcriptional regulator [Candidatus Colwellbacteria bacterium]|nr:YebC/PmpR family DNA-binding transcriptional regulator [Candidatus Colwellbacteria bacterium]
MAGHSKWKQIKHKKEASDKDRSRLFSKLTNIIQVAARGGADPEFNPVLRNAIAQAKRQNLPQATIERAIQKAKSAADALETLTIEAYGPEGIGLLVEAITDNRNRTMNELKSLFKNYETKLAEPGSLSWAFEKTEDGYEAKFKRVASEESREKIGGLTRALEDRDDVKSVYSSIAEV